jgi:undecaprenol kinase
VKNRPFYIRMGFAVTGICECWRTESSFRSHIVMALVAIVILAVVQPGAIWWALMSVAITLVMAFELLNSAVERLADHVHPAVHPEIGIIKDMASGGVLIAGVGAFSIALCLVSSLMWPSMA